MSKRKIALCNFMAGSGKDTLADHLVKNHGFKKYALADKIYDLSEELFGMKEKDRGILVAVGEGMRGVDKRVWINYLMNKVEKDGHDKVVITDVRKRMEYDYLKENGWEMIMIYCTPVEAVKRLHKRDNVAHENIITNESLDSELRDLVDIIPTVDNTGDLEDSLKQLEEILF